MSAERSLQPPSSSSPLLADTSSHSLINYSQVLTTKRLPRDMEGLLNKDTSLPPTANQIKTASAATASDENAILAKRKRYSYPLLNGNIPGVRRLPLSPIKPGTAGSSSDVFRKPNILVGSKSARGAPKRRASASLLDNKSPDYDIYDPMNSAAETFSAGCFHFQRNRILRRIRKPEEGPDAFAVLPDEMVLKIFDLIGRRGLFNCMLVNQRFRVLTADEVLWKRLDISGSFISPDCAKTIFLRQPLFLRLARSMISDPLDLSDDFRASQLTHLDLSMADITKVALARILSKCTSLVKCSLETLSVTGEVMKGMMSFCSSIETLNLAMCTQIELLPLSLFLGKCSNLKQLNMGCLRQMPNQTLSVEEMINSFPVGMERLNASGFIYRLRDEHVEQLVNRLPRLKELDLSDSQELTQKTVECIVDNLKFLEALGLSRCYSIPIGAYFYLPKAPLLRSVQMFAIFKLHTLMELIKSLPQIKINQEPCSTIARPTVGNKRSSIWGERVRDYEPPRVSANQIVFVSAGNQKQ